MNQETFLKTMIEWREAYQVTVFPEPDWVAARQALEAAGIPLDRVSAANYRYILDDVIKLLESEDEEEE